MSTLPEIKAHLPALYRNTAIVRRIAWVPVVVPFSVLFVLSCCLLGLACLVSFGVRNFGTWLHTGKGREMDGSIQDHVMGFWMDHGWYGVYRAFTMQQWHKPKAIVIDRYN